MKEKSFPEVRLTGSGIPGVVLGRDSDLVLVQVGTGLNSHRILVLESQLEERPDLRGVPELSLGVLKTYMV